MQASTSVPTVVRRHMTSSISSYARLTRLQRYRQTYGADRRTLSGNSAISRRETQIEINMDWKPNNNNNNQYMFFLSPVYPEPVYVMFVGPVCGLFVFSLDWTSIRSVWVKLSLDQYMFCLIPVQPGQVYGMFVFSLAWTNICSVWVKFSLDQYMFCLSPV